MPKIDDPLRDPYIESKIEAWKAFEAAFTRARNGNLTRRWENSLLTVFKRGDSGSYSWCINGEGHPQFSNNYEDEQDALSALWEATEGMDWP